MFKAVTQKIPSLTTRFNANEQGNIGIMFAGTAMMIMAAVGLAVDGAQMRKFKQELQATVDSAALAIAREQTVDAGERLDIATNYLASQSNLGTATINEASRNGATYIVDATIQYKTSFMHLFGFDTMDIRAAGTTIYDVRDINISLVLDSTGSMSGAKMASLKNAANELITSLDNVPGDSVHVSVVPFAQYVNIGPANASQPYMNVTTGGWNGCVGSRMGNLSQTAEHGGNDFPALSGVSCPTQVLPMTDNMNSARASINSMVASGWTYIPAGISWGWRTLTNSVPFTEVSASEGPNAEKIMIVMTDGANTRSKIGLNHNGWDRNAANAATGTLCTRVKNGDITIYTIAYEVTDITTQNLMRTCATTADNYYQAENSADLSNAFSAISASIQTLRLTN